MESGEIPLFTIFQAEEQDNSFESECQGNFMNIKCVSMRSFRLSSSIIK